MSEYSRENCRSRISRCEESVSDARQEIKKHFDDMDFDNATSYMKAEEIVEALIKKCKEIDESLTDAQFR